MDDQESVNIDSYNHPFIYGDSIEITHIQHTTHNAMNIRTHTHTHIHMHTYTHTNTHVHAHTHTHTHTHTHVHAYTHTLTYTIHILRVARMQLW
jgi:hypothetical protein